MKELSGRVRSAVFGLVLLAAPLATAQDADPAGDGFAGRPGTGVAGTGDNAGERVCPLHRVVLVEDEVPVHDGMLLDHILESGTGAADKHPYANTEVYTGNCIGTGETSRLVLYCSACRVAQTAWRELNFGGAGGNWQDQTRVRSVAFMAREGHIFDGRIYAPPMGLRNGAGVLLMGGGIGNDLDWTVPGSVTVNGAEQQLTISGEAHMDGPRIARALVDAGFVVMHWSTIRRDDPKQDGWPIEMTAYPMDEQVYHARRAIQTLRNQELFEPDRLFLLAHSLGGVRAVNTAAEDEGIAGLVLLGSAQATRTAPDDRGRNMNRAEAMRVMNEVDANKDGVCDLSEFLAWPAIDSDELAATAFGAADFDDDGALRPWELAGATARSNRMGATPSDWSTTDGSGLRWTEDLLPDLNRPVLFLYGAQDNAQAHHAPILAGLIEAGKLDRVSVEVIAGVGHQMGPEVDGRVGPIADETLAAIAAWLRRNMGRD